MKLKFIYPKEVQEQLSKIDEVLAFQRSEVMRVSGVEGKDLVQAINSDSYSQALIEKKADILRMSIYKIIVED